MEYKYDVFISYSSKDAKIADKICVCFNKNSITYFRDQEGIGFGRNYMEILPDIIRSSRFFLFLASKNSYVSPDAKREVEIAYDKKKPDKLYCLLPYIIDNTPFPDRGSIYWCLGERQYYSIKDDPIESKLVQKIQMEIQNEKAFDVKESSIADDRHFPIQTYTILGLLRIFINSFRKSKSKKRSAITN